MSDDVAVEVLPLGFSESGEPIEVPDGAVSWRVKLYKPGVKKPDLVRTEMGVPAMLPIRATPVEFRQLVGVGVGGRYRLEPVYADGRMAQSSEPAYIVLQEEATEAEANLSSTDALVVRMVKVHHESIAKHHELMNDMMADHRQQVAALAETNTKLVTSFAENFGSYLTGAADLLKASHPPVPEKPRNAMTVLKEFGEIKEVVEGLTDADPMLEIVEKSLDGALPLLRQVVHRWVLGLTPEQTAALTGVAVPPANTGTPTNGANGTPANGTAVTDFVAHLNAIESLLTADEATTARGAIGKMTPEQIEAWKTKLLGMTPTDAAAYIRAQLQK